MSGIVGQNTLDGSGLIKSPEGGGAWNFIKKLTASGDSSLSFVDGTDDVVLDSTYKTYVFTFNNIHCFSIYKLFYGMQKRILYYKILNFSRVKNHTPPPII